MAMTVEVAILLMERILVVIATTMSRAICSKRGTQIQWQTEFAHAVALGTGGETSATAEGACTGR